MKVGLASWGVEKGYANRIMRRWVMPSAAGATKDRKSDGVIHEGTARTPNMIPSESLMTSGTPAIGLVHAVDEDATASA